MWNQDLCANACRFAAKLHGDQRLSGSGYPYLLHIALAVSELMAALYAEEHALEDLAVQCAFLHDTLEDTECTYEELSDSFGSQVAEGVLALTKNPALPENKRMRDSLNRILEQPEEIWMVKLADRIANLSPPPPHWSSEKRRLYREEAALICERLGSASPMLKKRLLQKIAEYSAYL